MRISLAPLRYRDILSDFGGPIESVRSSLLEIRGRHVWHASANLVNSMPRKTGNLFYDNVDGNGASPSRQIAHYCAISEALERWAYFDFVESGSNREAFKLDPSTSGMAAFPGIGSASARLPALIEATERNVLMSWWEGRGEHFYLSLPDLSGIRIIHNLNSFPVVILWVDLPDTHFRCYGFSSGKDLESAVFQASVELYRNKVCAERHLKCLSMDRKPEPDSWSRRVVFFGEFEGKQLFDQRLSRATTSKSIVGTPAFDGTIIGPWSQYTHVWRVVFPPPSEDGFSDRSEYFLF